MIDPGLQSAIETVRRLYEERAVFQKRVGFGERPALIVVDMAYGWTDPDYAAGSQRLDETVAAIQQLLEVCRQKETPVVYTTSPVKDEPQEFNPSGEAGETRFRPWDARGCQIDERLQPAPGEWLIEKQSASAFAGTALAGYLIGKRVDTVIVTGCSTSACVRATVTDAKAYRFRPIVPRQAVQDRSPEAHEWNLFDLHAKFGDVLDLQEVLDYLHSLE